MVGNGRQWTISDDIPWIGEWGLHYTPPASFRGIVINKEVCFWEGNRQEGQGSSSGGNRLQMSDIFLSLSSSRRKQTSVRFFFFFVLYTNLKRGSLKILCCHDNTWLHLNLTFLKPWANQGIFLMEIFALSYVNILRIYPRLGLQISSA